MTQPMRCELAWCEAPHDDDTPEIAHHYKELGEFGTTKATINVVVNVVARWAEPLTGRRGVDPHVSIFTTAGSDEQVIDLTPREARIWAAQLAVLDGSPWLAEMLTAGADLLHEWEVDEFAGVPHRVEGVPRNTMAAHLYALKAAADAARITLEGFESIPVSAMEALDLARWVGEFRGIVRSMVETVDAIAEAGAFA